MNAAQLQQVQAQAVLARAQAQNQLLTAQAQQNLQHQQQMDPNSFGSPRPAQQTGQHSRGSDKAQQFKNMFVKLSQMGEQQREGVLAQVSGCLARLGSRLALLSSSFG